jgi:hypothetical protein
MKDRVLREAYVNTFRAVALIQCTWTNKGDLKTRFSTLPALWHRGIAYNNFKRQSRLIECIYTIYIENLKPRTECVYDLRTLATQAAGQSEILGLAVDKTDLSNGCDKRETANTYIVTLFA